LSAELLHHGHGIDGGKAESVLGGFSENYGGSKKIIH
jgi:hypothetical protein